MNLKAKFTNRLNGGYKLNGVLKHRKFLKYYFLRNETKIFALIQFKRSVCKLMHSSESASNLQLSFFAKYHVIAYFMICVLRKLALDGFVTYISQKYFQFNKNRDRSS